MGTKTDGEHGKTTKKEREQQLIPVEQGDGKTQRIIATQMSGGLRI